MTNATAGRALDRSKGSAQLLAELQSAVDKLTKQKFRATSAPWEITNRDLPDGHGPENEQCDIRGVAEGALTEQNGYQPALFIADADLIVTLHRTIDAQLNILRGELNFCLINGYSPSNNKLDLARAINGATK